MKQIIKTRATAILLLVIVAFNSSLIKAFSENDLLIEAKKITKDANIKFDKSLFLKSNGLCERVLSANPNNKLALYYSGYNQYRLLVLAMSNNNMEEFDEYFNSSISLLKQLTDIEEYNSESKTLLAAIYMMRLAVNQSEAPVLSIKIRKYLAEAIEANSNNPRAYLIKGNMLYNTPKMFGGSIDGAIEEYNKAIAIYELEIDSKKNIDWGYLETLAWKGMALSKKEDFANAKLAYEKALEVEPNYGWVKYKLLPGLKSSKKSDTTSIKESTAKLNIILTGFENNNGKLMVALNNSEDNYEENRNSFRNIAVQIVNNKAECSFDNLPFGEYAVKCYHDENNNSKLDKNFIGIPNEAYGFSNNARGSFGPPNFEDAKFTIDKNEVTIQLKVN